MFTGIIEQVGTIREIKPSQSNIELYVTSGFTPDLSIDQSISHNGVCLTVDALDAEWHRCTLIRETLTRTNFNHAKIGDLVNLERCVRMDARLDGHFVQGHVDCTVACMAVQDLQGSWVYRFELPSEYQSLVVDKGSICINGVSLTLSAIAQDYIEVSIIPYTHQHTNFNMLKPGSLINIEFDVLGKYIKRMVNLKKG